MSNEPEVHIDELFIGMTQPPMIKGVPMEFFAVNFIIFGIGVVMFLSLTAKVLFFICISLPLHAIAYVATEKDPHWMRIWLVKISKCPITQNKGFWKTNSYKP